VPYLELRRVLQSVEVQANIFGEKKKEEMRMFVEAKVAIIRLPFTYYELVHEGRCLLSSDLAHLLHDI
jgi:hypothetical protein